MMPDLRQNPRVALIGVSGYAKRHLDFLLSAHRAGTLLLQAAVAINPGEEIEQCRDLASVACPVHGDYMELLQVHRGKIDLCVIPTPIHHHGAMTLAALHAGANVLVEKPLTAEPGMLEKIQQAEQQSGRFVAIGFQDIYAEGTLTLKRMLGEGQVGQLVSLKACGLWPRNDAYYRRNNWAGRLRAGGVEVLDSPLNNAFAHHLNLMLFLAGPAFDESAAVTNIEAELFRARVIETFDTAAIRVQTSPGARLLMLASHSSREVWSPEVMIECTAGRAHWTLGGSLEIFDRDHALLARFAARDEAQAMQHMYGCVLRRLHDRNEFVCSTQIAARHVECIALLHRTASIHELAQSELVSLELANGRHTTIRHLEEYFRAAFDRGVLLGDTGCPWRATAVAADRGV